MKVDVVIVGAGPAGLCLARSLSGHGLSIGIIERQSYAELADPPLDGREIALTHASQHILETLGLWQRVRGDEIAVLRDAQVLNGPSPYALRIAAAAAGKQRLGCLVPNQAIRRAAHAAVQECADIQLLAECTINELGCSAEGVALRLSDGRRLQARLILSLIHI